MLFTPKHRFTAFEVKQLPEGFAEQYAKDHFAGAISHALRELLVISKKVDKPSALNRFEGEVEFRTELVALTGAQWNTIKELLAGLAAYGIPARALCDRIVKIVETDQQPAGNSSDILNTLTKLAQTVQAMHPCETDPPPGYESWAQVCHELRPAVEQFRRVAPTQDPTLVQEINDILGYIDEQAKLERGVLMAQTFNEPIPVLTPKTYYVFCLPGSSRHVKPLIMVSDAKTPPAPVKGMRLKWVIRGIPSNKPIATKNDDGPSLGDVCRTFQDKVIEITQFEKA